MSNVLVALESVVTKTGFVSGVLTRYADMFEEAEKVFVKPNVVSNEPYPTTTDPKVLDTVLTYLSSHNVVVGDGPAYDYSWRGKAGAVSHEHPLRSICDDHGVEWINLNPVSYTHLTLPTNREV